MRELPRWYNVEVSYQGDEVKNKNFTGLISRNTNISEVLKMLELTGVLQFKVTGREVTVLPDWADIYFRNNAWKIFINQYVFFEEEWSFLNLLNFSLLKILHSKN